MTRCPREHCHGLIIADDDGFTRCLMCGREPNAPAPLPLVHGSQLRRQVVALELTDAEREKRKARMAYARQYRERHAVGKAVG